LSILLGLRLKTAQELKNNFGKWKYHEGHKGTEKTFLSSADNRRSTPISIPDVGAELQLQFGEFDVLLVDLEL
jgi:hypothetical protein